MLVCSHTHIHIHMHTHMGTCENTNAKLSSESTIRTQFPTADLF